MTTAVPVQIPAGGRSAADAGVAGGRVQGALALGGLVLAVAVTVVLVATPPTTPGARGIPSSSLAVPAGVEVEVRGGEPFVAYELADRLARAGATMGAVIPATDPNALEDSTVIVYYDRGHAATAEQVRRLLGRGTLQRQQAFAPNPDVTIVLGKDLARL